MTREAVTVLFGKSEMVANCIDELVDIIPEENARPVATRRMMRSCAMPWTWLMERKMRLETLLSNEKVTMNMIPKMVYREADSTIMAATEVYIFACSGPRASIICLLTA